MMNYQPPSFESYIGSFEFDENQQDRPLSPLSPRTNNGVTKSPKKKKIVLKSSARDTRTKNRKTPNRNVPSASIASRSSNAASKETKERSLLNAGLSASEMLARLRVEKEMLIRRQQCADENAVEVDENVEENAADSSSMTMGENEGSSSVENSDNNTAETNSRPTKEAQVPLVVMEAPPPPPNPPPKHRQTVMASPRFKKADPMDDRVVDTDADLNAVDAKLATADAEVTDDNELLKRDEVQAKIIQESLSIESKGSFDKVKKMFKKDNSSTVGTKKDTSSTVNTKSSFVKKKKPTRLELARLRSLSILSKSSSPSSCGSHSAETKGDGEIDGGSVRSCQAVDDKVSERGYKPAEVEATESIQSQPSIKETEVQQVESVEAPAKKISVLNAGFNVSRLRMRRESMKRGGEKEKHEKVEASTVKKAEESKVDTSEGESGKSMKSVGSSRPSDKFGRDKKKATGINQAMSRASSAMSGNTSRSVRRRPVGASTSTEDDVSVISSTVSASSSTITTVQQQQSRGSNSSTKLCTNPAKVRQSHSARLARARSHRRAASNASLQVVAAEELDDAAIFSDLLPPSPTCRDQSVERNTAALVNRSKCNGASSLGDLTKDVKEETTQTSADASEPSSVSSVKSPPRMRRKLVGDVMSTIESKEKSISEKRKLESVKMSPGIKGNRAKVSSPLPKSEMVPASPSPGRALRRNRSLSRPRLARQSPSPSVEKNSVHAAMNDDKLPADASEATDTIVESPVSSSPSKPETPVTPTRAQSLSAFRAARKGIRSSPRTRDRSRDNAPAVVNPPDTQLKKSGDVVKAETLPPASPSVEIKKSSSTPAQKTESLASLRAVTRRGRQSSRPTAAAKESSIPPPQATPPRNSAYRVNKAEMTSNLTPPTRFNRRSRSLSQSRDSNEATPTPCKAQPPAKARAPAPTNPTGSPIDARHAAATQMRKNHRRRSNSMPRSQCYDESEPKSAPQAASSTIGSPFKQSAGTARVNKLKQSKLDEQEPKAEVILHGQFAASPRAASESSAVASHTAIMSILNKKAKKKSTFYVPIAQLCETVLPIQTLARVFLAKLALEKRKEAIVRVQAIFRRWSCQHYLSSCKFLVVRLQACHRGYVAREQTYFIHLGVLAATRLQACYRGMAARRDLRYQSYCATKIQALVRGHWQCIDYVETWSNIVLVQSIIRMRSSRKKFLIDHRAQQKAHEDAAATQIQACWRSFVCYTNYSNDLIDIVTIQSVARSWLALQQYQRTQRKLAEVSSSTLIAASWRGFATRREYIITVGGKWL